MFVNVSQHPLALEAAVNKRPRERRKSHFTMMRYGGKRKKNTESKSSVSEDGARATTRKQQSKSLFL